MNTKEISFDDFEVLVRREIQNFLDGTNKDSRYCETKLLQILKLEWTSHEDTSDEVLVVFDITMDKNFEVVDFSLQVDYTYGEDENNTYTSGSSTVPKSEEDYFQLSTVQDLGFRWEFYQYLCELFGNLKNV